MKNNKTIKTILGLLIAIVSLIQSFDSFGQNFNQTKFETVEVEGVNIFYREAGNPKNPTILLLHGYPTSSHMFRNLIDELADDFHLIAPDYPGYGRSDQPAMSEFDYSFKNISELMESFIKVKGLKKYSLYLMDYGAPIGFRIAYNHPEKIDRLIIQNGNAYEEGLEDFWDPFRPYWKNINAEEKSKLAGFHSPDGLKWQYTHGVNNPELISPDNWEIDLRHLSRNENNEIQMKMFYDYQFNLVEYPKWQSYFRKHQPKTLIIWGKNDYIFPASGAEAYKKDLKYLDFNLMDTGHFALESYGSEMAAKIKSFYKKSKKELLN